LFIISLEEYEDRTYNFKIKSILSFPTKNKDEESDEIIECFTLRFEKFDNLIAGGKLINLV
jgi:hypothetical protein